MRHCGESAAGSVRVLFGFGLHCSGTLCFSSEGVCAEVALRWVRASGVGHPPQVVGRDVAPLPVSLGQPPVLIPSQVRELQDPDGLVLLQGQLLLTARLERVHCIELRHTHPGPPLIHTDVFYSNTQLTSV